jgi:hypothetical protein
MSVHPEEDPFRRYRILKQERELIEREEREIREKIRSKRATKHPERTGGHKPSAIPVRRRNIDKGTVSSSENENSLGTKDFEMSGRSSTRSMREDLHRALWNIDDDVAVLYVGSDAEDDDEDTAGYTLPSATFDLGFTDFNRSDSALPSEPPMSRNGTSSSASNGRSRSVRTMRRRKSIFGEFVEGEHASSGGDDSTMPGGHAVDEEQEEEEEEEEEAFTERSLTSSQFGMPKNAGSPPTKIVVGNGPAMRLTLEFK